MGYTTRFIPPLFSPCILGLAYYAGMVQAVGSATVWEPATISLTSCGLPSSNEGTRWRGCLCARCKGGTVPEKHRVQFFMTRDTCQTVAYRLHYSTVCCSGLSKVVCKGRRLRRR